MKLAGERESDTTGSGPDIFREAWEIHIARKRLRISAIPLLAIGALAEAVVIGQNLREKRPLLAALHGAGLALITGAAYLRSLK